jgi:hypothetical protein
MKEFDKRKSHMSSKLHIIYISSNNVRRPVTKTYVHLWKYLADINLSKITLFWLFNQRLLRLSD